jgi:hypothetical protein
MRSAHLALATAAVFCALSAASAQDRGQGAAQDPAPQAVPAPAVEPPQSQTQARPPAPPDAVKDIVPQSAGRFSFTKVEGGLLRLDTQTGHMNFCSPHTVGWACEAVPEDRAALDAEIARLQRELARVKEEIAKAQLPPEPPRPPADLSPRPPGQAQGQDDAKLRFPNREEMERARAALERAWQHLLDMVTQLQKDMMKKG